MMHNGGRMMGREDERAPCAKERKTHVLRAKEGQCICVLWTRIPNQDLCHCSSDCITAMTLFGSNNTGPFSDTLAARARSQQPHSVQRLSHRFREPLIYPRPIPITPKAPRQEFSGIRIFVNVRNAVTQAKTMESNPRINPEPRHAEVQ